MNAALSETETFNCHKEPETCGTLAVTWAVDSGAKIIEADGQEIDPPVTSVSGKKVIVVRYDAASSTVERAGSIGIRATYTLSPDPASQTKWQYRTVVKTDLALGGSVSGDNE